MNITKLIPFNIRIKSLYWVIKENEIEADLTILFNKIDMDEYDAARVLLNELECKWIMLSHTAPNWFDDHIAKFAKANAMLNFFGY